MKWKKLFSKKSNTDFAETSRHRRIRRATTILAALVVFLTTYMLILPAISLDRTTSESLSGIYMKKDMKASGISSEGQGALEDLNREPQESGNGEDTDPSEGETPEV